MKKRVFTLLNFLALNVLFFALYLNFIHKDTNVLPAVSAASNVAVKNLSAEPIKNTAIVTTQSKEKATPVEN